MKKHLKSDLLSDIITFKHFEVGEEFSVSQFFEYDNDIKRERFDISNEEQAKFYGKAIGRYELLSIPNPLELDKKQKIDIANIFVEILKEIIGKITTKDKILVVGLGNRHISADSLGTKVIKNINITFGKKFPKVMAICPSVLGLTGIETYEIVRGVIDRVKPSHLILLDSLCASDVSRLGRSIQVSNTGLCPGSGIGNRRKCLDHSLAPNVVSIGVPLLIYASTFLSKTFDEYNITNARINSIMQSIKNAPNKECFLKFFQDLKKCLDYNFEDTIVSIKDIEECVEILADIISKAINISLGVDFE